MGTEDDLNKSRRRPESINLYTRLEINKFENGICSPLYVSNDFFDTVFPVSSDAIVTPVTSLEPLVAY
jgi:hypothetical protein